MAKTVGTGGNPRCCVFHCRGSSSPGRADEALNNVGREPETKLFA